MDTEDGMGLLVTRLVDTVGEDNLASLVDGAAVANEPRGPLASVAAVPPVTRMSSPALTQLPPPPQQPQLATRFRTRSPPVHQSSSLLQRALIDAMPGAQITQQQYGSQQLQRPPLATTLPQVPPQHQQIPIGFPATIFAAPQQQLPPPLTQPRYPLVLPPQQVDLPIDTPATGMARPFDFMRLLREDRRGRPTLNFERLFTLGADGDSNMLATLADPIGCSYIEGDRPRFIVCDTK